MTIFVIESQRKRTSEFEQIWDHINGLVAYPGTLEGKRKAEEMIKVYVQHDPLHAYRLATYTREAR